jgi:hypothetical protein
MAKHPRLSDTNGTQPSDAAPAYVVGYGRPPVHTRFKPGHTKRGGRPKGQRNARTALEAILNEKITLREGKRSRSLSKRDAMYLRIANDAVSGNEKAQSKVIALMQSHRLNGEPQEATNREPFTADDEAVIADFLWRHGNQVEPTQPPESTDKPESGEAQPTGKEIKETQS